MTPSAAAPPIPAPRSAPGALYPAGAVPFVDIAAQHRPMREALLAAVGRVIDHGQFILGPEVAELEQRWAAACRVRHAIGVSNGTDALYLLLKALGVGAGDEVITAPNSFLASSSCVIMAGGTPAFCDVGDDFNIDPSGLAAALTPRTKGIIAVHLAGRPADMDRIRAFADRAGLWVLEDAAQAFGAAYRDRPVGSLARAAAFSLHPLKTAGACGDGGMITTDDDDLAAQLRLVRNHGLQRRQEDCEAWGCNMRLDTVQAALMLVKLDHVDEWIAKRRSHAGVLRERLSGLLDLPPDRVDDFVTYQTFLAQADDRDGLAAHLAACGVGCAVHYRTPIHRLAPAVAMGLAARPLPIADRQAERIISLPIHQDLDAAQLDAVCRAVEGFYRTGKQEST